MNDFIIIAAAIWLLFGALLQFVSAGAESVREHGSAGMVIGHLAFGGTSLMLGILLLVVDL